MQKMIILEPIFHIGMKKTDQDQMFSYQILSRQFHHQLKQKYLKYSEKNGELDTIELFSNR